MNAIHYASSDRRPGLNGLGIVYRSRRAALATILCLCAVLMPGSSAYASDRPFGGSCNTVFALTGVGVAEYEGTCHLLHLGLTRVVATQIVIPNPDGTLFIPAVAVYTAANGDELFANFVGIAVFTGPTSALLLGTETYVRGTGRFADASGSVALNGTAEFTSATGGVAEYTAQGRISY